MSKLNEQDGTLSILRRYKIPVTKENWVLLATAGMPIELDAEMAEEIADLGVSYIMPDTKVVC